MSVRSFSPSLGAKSKQSAATAAGLLAVIVMVLSGSTSTTFSKVLADNLSPFSLLFVSEFITLIFTVISFGLVNLVQELLAMKKRDYVPLVLVGLSNSVLAPILIFMGLRYTNAINAELSSGSNIFFMFILAILFLHERISRTHIAAAGTIFFGVVIVALRGFTTGFTPNEGDVMIILGSLMYASGTALFKMRLNTLHPDVFLFSRGLVAIAAFFLTAPFMEHTFVQDLQSAPVRIISILVAYGFISRFVYLFSFYEALERMEVHVISLLLPLVTIGSLGFAHVYLGDEIEWYHFVGALCICMGTVILRLPTKHTEEKYHVKKHLKANVRAHM